jgi:hypothetical protein
MKKFTRSLLEELTLAEKKDTKHIIENRGTNVISSAIHLLEVIERNYGKEAAQILERKLFVAIKSRDAGKFTRSLRKSGENNDEEK